MRTRPSHDSGRSPVWRSRWAAIGAAVAVSVGGGGLFVANAASGPPSATITIDPVRILDTRDPLDLGLAGPFVSAIGLDLQVTGSIPTSGGTQVVVPDGATGVLLNVTALNPSANGFVSVRPADATGRPTSSNLNVLAGQIIPNAVTVQLPTVGPDKGKIEITYDALGVAGPTSEILVDVVGFLQEGAAGPKGDKGDPGANGLNATDPLPAGMTMTGEFAYDTHQDAAETASDEFFITFPLEAPSAVSSHGWASGSGFSGDSPACTGTVTAPTAPEGMVCVYPGTFSGIDAATTFAASGWLPTDGFVLGILPAAVPVDGADKFLNGTWAYTALSTARPLPEAGAPAEDRKPGG